MKVLLVDGYNVIYAHPDLSGLVGKNQEAAREGLLRELSPLASPEFYELVIVVFDAAGSRQLEPVIEDRGGMRVAFTRHGQTADSFIEAAVRHLVSECEVYVATSDRLVVTMTTGFGARSVDGKSLLRMAREALLETREEIERISGESRTPLEDRVSEEARRLLEKIRFQ